MCFQIDLASVIVGTKFTVFALFHFVFEGNFPTTTPGALIFGWETIRRAFCVNALGGGLHLKGLIHGVAYFRNFTVCCAN